MYPISGEIGPMSNKKVNTGGEKKMQGRGVAGNCLHPPIAKTKHGLARSLPLFTVIPIL